MPIRLWKCKKCEKTKKTFKKDPMCCGEKMKEVLGIPRSKILEPIDPEKGKSDIKNQDEVLLRRAKEYARDVDMDELILQSDLDTADFNGWLSKDGSRKRKKIEDS